MSDKEEIKDQPVYWQRRNSTSVCVLFIVFNSGEAAEGRGLGLLCVASKAELELIWLHWRVKCLNEMGSFLWK